MKSKFLNQMLLNVKKKSPEILVGVGVAGMITATILAVKATPKALKLIEEEEKAKGEELTKVEIVKTTWKPYLPVAILIIVSASCIIGADSIKSKRNAALITAYKISEKALSEYKEKVVEVIGDKKEKIIRNKINEKHLKENPTSQKEIIITGKGHTMCYDSLSGRYFESDIDCIRRAENEINKNMMNDMYVSLNEFYDELNLKHTKLGDILGWHIEDGLINLSFDSHLAEDGTPCIVIDYINMPKCEYDY